MAATPGGMAATPAAASTAAARGTPAAELAQELFGDDADLDWLREIDAADAGAAAAGSAAAALDGDDIPDWLRD